MREKLARWLDHHMREVLKGAIVVFPLRLLGASLAFALNILLARMLGVEDTGLYFLALTITGFATTIAALGLASVLLRHAASGVAQSDLTGVQDVAHKGTRIAFFCAIGLTVLLASTANWLPETVLGKAELGTALRWMALTIIPQTELMLHAALLRGLKKIALSQLLLNIGLPVLTMLFLVLLGGTYGITGAVWAYSLASLITALMAYWMWRRAIGSVKPGPGKISSRDLFRSGFPLLQSQLMAVQVTTMLMLGAMSTSGAVAIYGVAYRTTKLLRFILLAFNIVVGPKFAALHSMTDEKALSSTSRQSTLLMTLAASPILLAFIAFPGWIMSFFGEQFISGASVLLVLAVAQYIAVISGSTAPLLIMSGNEKLLRNNSIAAFALSLLLNLILIPRFGALGAAISTCVAVIIRNMLGMIQIYRHLGILPFFVRDPSEQPNDL